MTTQLQPLKTCQVCGRVIKSVNGVTAHHGYKRPGDGWQTPSCLGARYVPYEVSCERLRDVVELTKKQYSHIAAALEMFLQDPPQSILVVERRSSWGKPTEVPYEKPEDFDRNNNYRASIPRTYECAYADKVRKMQRTLRSIEAEIAYMERRLQDWRAPLEGGSDAG